MPEFRCPVCDQHTIRARQKWASSSFSPAVCSNCKAEVYASSRLTALWRIAEALLVTLIVILSLVSGNPSALLIALFFVVILEIMRVLLVPLVKLERVGGGFR
ncbi:MAG: hypothetical protein U5K33_08935 [Halofilum sp. (in: g-proteobacteria)]|nr:hypothetical protein [Halofilum sp. (in: g-proteobacteria)]